MLLLPRRCKSDPEALDRPFRNDEAKRRLSVIGLRKKHAYDLGARAEMGFPYRKARSK